MQMTANHYRSFANKSGVISFLKKLVSIFSDYSWNLINKSECKYI